MILEIYASLVISTANIKEAKNVSSNTYSHIIPGDSAYQQELRERDRLLAEQVQRSRRQTLAREKAQRASGGGTVLEVIGEYRVKGGCVPYAWSQGMQTRGYGLARNYPVTQEPQAFAITYEGWEGHAVVIEKDLGDKVQVRDANYRPGLITRRVIPKSIIKGYLS